MTRGIPINAAWIMLLGALFPTLAGGSALDDYVTTTDPSYSWQLTNTIEGEGYTTFVVRLNSQRWRGSGDVDAPEWAHWLTVVKPDAPVHDTAILWIDGGDRDDPAPAEPDPLLVEIASKTGAATIKLEQVPNQPLTFSGEETGRREDEIIAYTFDKYMRTGDETWPLLLPMVKSAVRAMDATQALLATERGGSFEVKEFLVGGASKRGWTSWLTAAVDRRVSAVFPVVADMLNVDEQMPHHHAAYGYYSEAISDYDELGVIQRLDSGPGQSLLSIVDPYEYRDRYAHMPKFILNSTGDQFFLPDSWRFYYKELPGQNYLRYVPNTDHGLNETAVVQSLITFYQGLMVNDGLPRFSWTLEQDRSFMVRTVDDPLEVRLWQATATEGRDFRLESLGPAWTSSSLAEEQEGVYIGRVPEPSIGYTAYMVELTYPGTGSYNQRFTTGVNVVPDTLPFALSEIRIPLFRSR